MFCDDTRTYASKWAAIYNPYADKTKGQQEYDWFRFDESGYMVTGWFTDVDGNRYYLNPVSDGTQGRMVTGCTGSTECAITLTQSLMEPEEP